MSDGPLGDSEAAADTKRRAAAAGRRERKDLAAVMATPEGRRLLWRLLLKANVFGDEYATDARDHARLSGFRAFGVDLLTEMQVASPADYVHMVNEQFALSARAAARKADRDE